MGSLEVPKSTWKYFIRLQKNLVKAEGWKPLFSRARVNINNNNKKITSVEIIIILLIVVDLN